jgi:hypothetical protein
MKSQAQYVETLSQSTELEIAALPQTVSGASAADGKEPGEMTQEIHTFSWR